MQLIGYVIAGILALAAAAVHGGLGERIVVMRLRKDTLPRTQFGGEGASLAMIRVSWHIVTMSFAATGAALLACAGSSAAACDGIGKLVAVLFGGYFVVAGVVAIRRQTKTLIARHPAPLIFAAIAVLSWLGST